VDDLVPVSTAVFNRFYRELVPHALAGDQEARLVARWAEDFRESVPGVLPAPRRGATAEDNAFKDVLRLVLAHPDSSGCARGLTNFWALSGSQFHDKRDGRGRGGRLVVGAKPAPLPALTAALAILRERGQ
jgi:hypothetical protein